MGKLLMMQIDKGGYTDAASIDRSWL